MNKFIIVVLLFLTTVFIGCDKGEIQRGVSYSTKNNSNKVATIAILKEEGVTVQEFVLEPQEVIAEIFLDSRGSFYEVYLEDKFAYGCDDRPRNMASYFPGREYSVKKTPVWVYTYSLFIWCGDELCEDQCDNQYDEPRKYGDQSNACPDGNKFCHSHAGKDWSQASLYYMEREDGETYCKDIGGRLPSISELRTLIRNCPQTEYPKPENQDPWCDAVEDENNEIVVSDPSICNPGCEGDLNVFGYNTSTFLSSTTEDSIMNWVIHFEQGRIFRTPGGIFRVICVK